MIKEKVNKTIKKYNLLDKGDRVLIAYSGGVDSSGMLAVLLELREQWEIELFLAHFNHELRKRAAEDEQFVRCVAKKHSLPLFVGRENVRSYARRESLNLEEAGRRLRYEFLFKTATDCSASKIATGHTMTDQAETFLMRLLRGSGARGLGGIYPAVEGIIIRPLLQIEREEIEAYLSEQNLSYRIDESNFDRRFLRNRIRLEFIPFVQKKFEPKIIHHLSHLASILREEDDLLEKIGKEEAKKAFFKKSDTFLLNMKFISSLPLALRRRVIRNFILEIKGDLRGVSFSDVESLAELGEGKEYYFRKGLVLKREKNHVFLKEESPPEIKYEHMWSGEGRLEIKELGLIFEGRKIRKDTHTPLCFNDQNRAYLNLKKLTFPLRVRNRQDGDKYQPLGAPGKKKLKEIMRAKGIPLFEREKKPVFLTGKDIVWVLGLPVSEKFKVERKSEVIFLIQRL
ncbi:MAG: tRNA lysidine(34) synthetase TilS [Candidatus Aminicenantaceae bacterium]